MRYLSLFLLVIIVSSCSTSSNVVRNGFFQKRKYKKGYHLSFKKKEVKSRESKEEVVLLANNSNHSEGVKELRKKTTSIQFSEYKKTTQSSPVYASINSSERIEFQTKLSAIIGDTLVDDYVSNVNKEVGLGIKKVKIKRSRFYRVLALVSAGVFLLGMILFPQLGVFAKFLIIPYLTMYFGYFSSLFNLAEYTNIRGAEIKNANLRDEKLMNRSKKVKNLAKLTLVFFVLSLLLFFGIILFPSLSIGISTLLMVLWFIASIHFMVFLIMSIVNYLILYFSLRKEMKYDMSR